VFQHNSIREGYFKASVTMDRGRHEWKAGVEADNTFCMRILHTTSPIQRSSILGRARLLLRCAGRTWSRRCLCRIRCGSRTGRSRPGALDHYQLLLNRQSLQPRIAISHYFPGAQLMVHGAYDRVFQTPSFENILLSSSSQVESISPGNFLRLPVEPSRGDYYEVGLTKAFWKNVRLDANYFRRNVNNFADDDQIRTRRSAFRSRFAKGSFMAGRQA